MKKFFLSAVFMLTLLPAAFANGAAFDFFTGTGFSLGMFYGENFHWGYGFVLDGHSSELEATPRSSNGSTTYTDTESVTRWGAYYQMDYSYLPFKIQAVQLGFNAGAQVGFVYTSLEYAFTPIDIYLSPFIAVEARFKNVSAIMGWKGIGYLMEGLVETYNDDLNNITYTDAWKNSFLMGVRYTFRNANRGGSITTSTDTTAPGSSDSTRTRIISGSGVWSAQ